MKNAVDSLVELLEDVSEDRIEELNSMIKDFVLKAQKPKAESKKPKASVDGKDVEKKKEVKNCRPTYDEEIPLKKRNAKKFAFEDFQEKQNKGILYFQA